MACLTGICSLGPDKKIFSVSHDKILRESNGRQQIFLLGFLVCLSGNSAEFGTILPRTMMGNAPRNLSCCPEGDYKTIVGHPGGANN